MVFAEALWGVGQRIEQDRRSYHTPRKRPTGGRGNLLRQIDMLREPGAEDSKEEQQRVVRKELPAKELSDAMEKEMPEVSSIQDGPPRRTSSGFPSG